MPKKRSLKSNQVRKPRYNLSISPISGLEAYFRASPNGELLKCVVWNVSSEGACILINGSVNLNIGSKCILKCNASFERMDYVYNCSVRWFAPEVFVTFIGVSFDGRDNGRDEFFNSFRQID